MISLILGLTLLTLLLGIGFAITGALLTACIWLFIKLPIAIFLFALGLVFCCTILLIPVGLGCFRGGLSVLMPCRI